MSPYELGASYAAVHAFFKLTYCLIFGQASRLIRRCEGSPCRGYSGLVSSSLKVALNSSAAS